jgi:hypothetical protein
MTASRRPRHETVGGQREGGAKYKPVAADETAYEAQRLAAPGFVLFRNAKQRRRLGLVFRRGNSPQATRG